MDIIKFNNPDNPTQMYSGEIINNIKRKMWVERFREAGEFKLVAGVDSGLREKLPIGTFISHTGTPELMIVENHEISEQRGQDSDIVITGRGYETYFEQRIIGASHAGLATGEPETYTLVADYTWNQAGDLIRDHIYEASVFDPNDALDYALVLDDNDGTGESVARDLSFGELYPTLMALLEVDNLGIKVYRPGPWSPIGVTDLWTAFVIHKGVDRRESVVLSYASGEIENADYFWSNRGLKNAAFIYSKWVQLNVGINDAAYGTVDAPTNYDRRVMVIDATDVDSQYAEYPDLLDLAIITAKLYQRARLYLLSQKETALTKAEAARDSLNVVYRKDYNVGDIVTVIGGYNESTTMRVAEHVEIEDETGQHSYPTLTRE